jgi:hypothetical protein
MDESKVVEGRVVGDVEVLEVALAVSESNSLASRASARATAAAVIFELAALSSA